MPHLAMPRFHRFLSPGTIARAIALLCAAMLALSCARWASADGHWSAAPSIARPLPPLSGTVEWINSRPLDAQSVRGKVVLIDFWTYSCINCLRMLPYLRAWSTKYGPHGLVVIGVHTPEFDFERDEPNVRRAVKDLNIAWPVAVDSRHALWNAFGVSAWPTLFFVDANGRIRDRQLGEGGYDVAERRIQQLLREAGQREVPDGLVAPQGRGTQSAPGPRAPLSSETYLGAARAQAFVSASSPSVSGAATTFAPAQHLDPGEWTLAGGWRVDDERIEARQAGARIAYRFRARDVHLVLGAAPGSRSLRFRVRVDGQPPGSDHGTDINADGVGVIDGHRLYQLVRQVGDDRRPRTIEIEFLDPGAWAYSFTFG